MPHIDTDRLKRDCQILDVVAHYGITLRQSGQAWVGRCPFHRDGGRPNFHVYARTNSWYCFRCGVGGDVICFVQKMEGVGFLEAADHLLDGPLAGSRACHPAPLRVTSPTPNRDWGASERACLAAAIDLYSNRLFSDPVALAYVRRRSLHCSTLELCRVGYASGDELVTYLRWRRLPMQAAVRVGLLTPRGREFFAGRIVIPEVRAGQPIWLIGRALETDSRTPRYLALPGRKPLLGWGSARRSPWVIVTEGPFDWLTLRQWDVPALALIGTHVRVDAARALRRFERVYLALDNDDAGRAAAEALGQTLGPRAVLLALPGVKDVADLAADPQGRRAFMKVLREAARRSPRRCQKEASRCHSA